MEPILDTRFAANITPAMTTDDIAIYGLIATIFLAIITWIINVWLQQKNIRDQHKAKIGYEIYREMVMLHKELQNAIAKFISITSAPLILMSTELIPLELRAQFGESKFVSTTSEEECLDKGLQKYSNWISNDLLKNYNLYKDSYLKFLYLTEDWTAPLAATKNAQKVLRQELNKMDEQMSLHLEALRYYSHEHGEDWREWDQDDVYRHGQAITELMLVLASSYIHDFMVIAHNELLTPYYGHRRTTRKTMDPELKVLIPEGLTTNIEDDSVARATAEEVIRNHA